MAGLLYRSCSAPSVMASNKTGFLNPSISKIKTEGKAAIHLSESKRQAELPHDKALAPSP